MYRTISVMTNAAVKFARRRAPIGRQRIETEIGKKKESSFTGDGLISWGTREHKKEQSHKHQGGTTTTTPMGPKRREGARMRFQHKGRGIYKQ